MFCRYGTGRDFKKACVPKLSEFEFIMYGHSVIEYWYLTYREQGTGEGGTIGSDANFMFEVRVASAGKPPCITITL